MQSVVLVVMKFVPPTLSLTHSFLRGGEEEVEVTVTVFVEAAMAECSWCVYTSYYHSLH